MSQTEGMKTTDPHLEQFRNLTGEELVTADWIKPMRNAGIERFAEAGFPTLKDEDWRFTNVNALTKFPFVPVVNATSAKLKQEDLDDFVFATIDAHRLVFVDGIFSKEYSTELPTEEGIIVSNLATALSTHRETIEKHLNQYSQNGTPFNSLNDAFFQDGVFIHVGKGKRIEKPVHLLYVSTNGPAGSSTNPRNLVVAEDQSQLTLLETYASISDAPGFTNAVSEFIVGNAAKVEHCKFQDENIASFHLASLHSHMGRDAQFTSHSIASGAKISRNTIRTTLDGEGINCVLNGLYLTHDDQLADHHMVVDHAKPNCESHEYFNGILEDQSKGVFHGRILVRPDAQKTDAKQTNKNLLLSDDATVDTKPQLEIYADDVKCTHGATIGQLNEDSIFYLRARGISEHKARRMLVHAFAGEIIDRIECEVAREELDEWVHMRLEHKCKSRRGKS